MEEKYPVHPTVKVLKGETVFKTASWWSAVLLVETEFTNNPVVKLYKWKKKGNSWVRKASFTVSPKYQGKIIKAIQIVSSGYRDEEATWREDEKISDLSKEAREELKGEVIKRLKGKRE